MAVVARAAIFDLLFMVLFIVLSFVSRKGFLPAWGQEYGNGNEPLLNGYPTRFLAARQN
jgi:hypothetical protein